VPLCWEVIRRSCRWRSFFERSICFRKARRSDRSPDQGGYPTHLSMIVVGLSSLKNKMSEDGDANGQR
jgi:hypothetical protein